MVDIVFTQSSELARLESDIVQLKSKIELAFAQNQHLLAEGYLGQFMGSIDAFCDALETYFAEPIGYKRHKKKQRRNIPVLGEDRIHADKPVSRLGHPPYISDPEYYNTIIQPNWKSPRKINKKHLVNPSQVIWEFIPLDFGPIPPNKRTKVAYPTKKRKVL